MHSGHIHTTSIAHAHQEDWCSCTKGCVLHTPTHNPKPKHRPHTPTQSTSIPCTTHTPTQSKHPAPQCQSYPVSTKRGTNRPPPPMPAPLANMPQKNAMMPVTCGRVSVESECEGTSVSVESECEGKSVSVESECNCESNIVDQGGQLPSCPYLG